MIDWQNASRQPLDGYWLRYVPSHPNRHKSGYVLEHRLVMEDKLDRFLLPGEVVHHVNGDRGDNRPENLELIASQAIHAREHLVERNRARGGRPRHPRTLACPECGDDFITGSGKKQASRRFCSRSCYYAHRLGGGQLKKGVMA